MDSLQPISELLIAGDKFQSPKSISVLAKGDKKLTLQTMMGYAHVL
jgi:hypothetical protein